MGNLKEIPRRPYLERKLVRQSIATQRAEQDIRNLDMLFDGIPTFLQRVDRRKLRKFSERSRRKNTMDSYDLTS